MRKTKNILRKAATMAVASALAISTLGVSAFGYDTISNQGELDGEVSTFRDTTGSSNTTYTSWKTNVWDAQARENSGLCALAPGKTEADLNFAWYSVAKGTPAVRVYEEGKQSAAKVVKGTATAITASNVQGNTYAASNKVSVEGYFEAGKNYIYQYTDNYTEDTTSWSGTYEYTAQASDKFSVILTGDPQIGASGSNGQGTVDDTDVARDTYNWNLTMERALTVCPNAAFLISAGDQINQNISSDADKLIKESEYAGYLYPEAFRSLPIAATIGNHDRDGVDYTQHFNNANASELGKTEAGGDFYFSYGDVLIISINSNNRNQEEHRQLLEKAVASNEDAAWKVVTFHSDIYGAGSPHADSDATANRVVFAPLMDEFDIDICLTGHDHTYSRSYQILDGNVIDYDITSGSVTDPEGTLYITTGSGSGSKYYTLLNYTPYYIADRSNAALPSFSTIDFTSDSLTLKTYDYNGNRYADDFTIKKTTANESAEETVAKADKIDTSKYTDASVKKLTDAAKALKSLIASYTTTADTGLTTISTTFGTDDDVVSGYGSVKDKTTNGDDSAKNWLDGKVTNYNRFKEGFSTLLDKTIYTQFNGEDAPIVDSATIIEAQKAVNDAITGLVAKSTGTTNSGNPSNKEDVNSGEKNMAGVYAALAIALGAGIFMVTRKKEDNCEEQ